MVQEFSPITSIMKSLLRCLQGIISEILSHSLSDFYIAYLSLHSIRFCQLALAVSPLSIGQIAKEQLVLGAVILLDQTTLPQGNAYYFLQPMHLLCISKEHTKFLAPLPGTRILGTLVFCQSNHHYFFIFAIIFVPITSIIIEFCVT